MKRLSSLSMMACVLATMVLPGLLPGCFQPVTPPASAVLAGTWAVTAENTPELKQLLFTFDANGNLQTVQYQIAANAIITVPSPFGETSVEDDAVTISMTFFTNTLAFNGTLNDAKNVITGDLTTRISVAGASVAIDHGPATLTRQ